MGKWIACYLIGLVFGIGISISGMANPAKVINFFDLAGHWDPSLLFVMGGAVITTFVGYKLTLGRETPVFDHHFHLPTEKSIDTRLIAGSAIFGVGWGIAGFCPGGALPALGTLHPDVYVFFLSLVVGIVFAQWLQSQLQSHRSRTATVTNEVRKRRQSS